MTPILAGLLLGAVFGAAARTGRFCLLRGLKSLGPGTGDAAALRAFALAMAVALAGAQALHAAGLVDLGQTVARTATNPWPSLLAGGVIFGLGMALANACGARSLVLLAGGNLRSLLVLLCLGLAAQASLTGVLSPLRMALMGLGGSAPAGSLPQALMSRGLDGTAALALAVALPALLLAGIALPLLRRAPVEAAMAAVVGLCVAGGWWLSTVTGDPFDPSPPVSLSFVGPMGESLLWAMLSTGRAASFGIAVVGGTILGALGAALVTGGFRPEGFGSAGQMARAAAGGTLMGFGGVLALGCSIGQGLSGFSTLSLGSLTALAGIVAGALAGLALFPQSAKSGAVT